MDLKIQILVEKAGNGDKQAIEELGNLARASDRAAGATKAHAAEAGAAGETIEAFGRKGGHAREAYEGLERVLQGGPRTLFGVASAWRALTGAMAANPFTAIAVVAIALWPVIEKLGEVFGTTGERAKEMAKEMDEAGERAKKRVESIDKLRLDALHAQLDLTRDKGKDALEMLQKVAAAAESIASAKDAADIAAIKAGPGTEEDKTKQIAAIDQGGRERKRAGTLGGLDAEDANAAATAAAAKIAAGQAAAEVRKQQTTVARFEQARAANEAAIKAAEDKASKRKYATGVLPVDNADADAADAMLPGLQDHRATIEGQLTGSQHRLELLKKDAEDARAAAKKASDEAAKKVASSNVERGRIAGVGGFEDQRAATETGVELRDARRKDTIANARATETAVGGINATNPAGRAMLDQVAKAAREAAAHPDHDAVMALLKEQQDLLKVLIAAKNKHAAEIRQLSGQLRGLSNESG